MTNEDPQREDWYTAKKHNVFISMPKYIFDNDLVAQSLMSTVYLSVTSKDYTADVMYTQNFWLMSLGESYDNKTTVKGESVLESLESIYDIGGIILENIPLVYNTERNTSPVVSLISV